MTSNPHTKGEDGLFIQPCANGAADFVIVSLKWTRPRDAHVTFWRPNRAGYCWPLSWAGRYTEAEARGIDDGEDNIAVPLDVALALSREPKPGLIDGNAGPVVGKRLLGALRKARIVKADPSR